MLEVSRVCQTLGARRRLGSGSSGWLGYTIPGV